MYKIYLCIIIIKLLLIVRSLQIKKSKLKLNKLYQVGLHLLWHWHSSLHPPPKKIEKSVIYVTFVAAILAIYNFDAAK